MVQRKHKRCCRHHVTWHEFLNTCINLKVPCRSLLNLYFFFHFCLEVYTNYLHTTRECLVVTLRNRVIHKHLKHVLGKLSVKRLDRLMTINLMVVSFFKIDLYQSKLPYFAHLLFCLPLKMKACGQLCFLPPLT